MGKFVASYSGGKDGAFAIYKAMERGMVPLALITTFNEEQNRSWFHRVPEAVLEDAADSIGVPLRLIKTVGDDYETNFEAALRDAKEKGADACVFGDIDIEEHIGWCSKRCANAGIEPLFPLYGQSRENVVNGFIESGFTAYITIINTDKLSGDLLGKRFTKEAVSEIKAQGADICGENGEYHTFVIDGPIYRRPVAFSFGEGFMKDKRVYLPVD